ARRVGVRRGVPGGRGRRVHAAPGRREAAGRPHDPVGTGNRAGHRAVTRPTPAVYLHVGRLTGMTLVATPTDLVAELTPTVERLFERHLGATKPWLPHELVPWERAAESDPRARWDADTARHSFGVRSALVVNLLTEDNLPYYYETLHRVFANDVWREWA